MSCRKWLVRGLVGAAVAGLAAGVLLYQRWTNPESIRRRVLEQLGEHFVGARVSLESAHFQLFGAIAVSDVRLSRRDDLDKTDFAYVPSLTIHLDKEQLLHGKQAIRKLELDRPRFRIVRAADGRWNLADILGPVDLNERIPTIVVQHGTISIEDRLAAPGAAPVEIRDVSLTLINDPLPTLTIEGAGTSELGPLQISAAWQRATYETKVSLDAPVIPVGPALVQRLSGYFPEAAKHARELEGVAKLRGELEYHPDAKSPGGQNPSSGWTHDIHCHLSKGKLHHALLPLPLDDIEASWRCVNGQVPLVKLSARAGQAKVDLTLKDLDLAPEKGDGTSNVTGPVPFFGGGFESSLRELDLKIQHLPLTKELFASLPKCLEDVRNLPEDFDLQGAVNLDYTLKRDGSAGCRKHCLIRPENLSGTFFKFPYLLERLSGTVEYVGMTGQSCVVKLELIGYAGEVPIHIKGEIREPVCPAQTAGSEKPPSVVAVDIWGDDAVLDEKLLAALTPKGQQTTKYERLARSFKPTGLGNFHAFIRRDGTSRRYANQYLMHFHHAALRYQQFDYPLENVTGTLDIQPDHWEFRDFRGTHNGGEFRTSGRSVPTPEGDGVAMAIQGANILLNDELKNALDEELRKTWVQFEPTGRIDFTGRIDIPPRAAGLEPAAHSEDAKPDIDLIVTARGCSIRPEFFQYRLHDLSGKIRYAKRWVQFHGLTARHGPSAVSLDDGLVYLKPEGGSWAKLVNLRANPLLPDTDFLRALPPCLCKAVTSLELKDPVALETQLVIDTKGATNPPIIYWDGSLALRDASVQTGVKLDHVTGQVACRGLHNGRQLEGVAGNLAIDQATLFKQQLQAIRGQLLVSKEEPDILKLPGLYGRFCGGEIYGPIRVEFGPTIRYELNLAASKIKLEEFARQNPGMRADMSGEVSAQLYLSGQGPDLDALRGGGSIDVPKGKMSNLPPLVDLLKFLALRLPDRTAFEEAHAEFDIQGQRARVKRLDLFGHAISLRGKGDLNLDGTDLNLDFNADWARVTQVLPPVINQIPPAFSNGILRIHMRGKVDDPKFNEVVMPVVMDPWKKVWNGIFPNPNPNSNPNTKPDQSRSGSDSGSGS
jgi:hypothetical protein